MKAVMVMYDTLRLDVLPCYEGKQIELPNFQRLAEHTTVFDNSYVCSLPCMPARRELHTGRANFLHREWGPLEPFDDSMPELLKQSGIYTRIVTDHQHYVEDGGGSYLPRFSTWECNRGQEGDPWIGDLRVQDRSVESPHSLYTLRKVHPWSWDKFSEEEKRQGRLGTNAAMQDLANREATPNKADFPQTKTFNQGCDFIEKYCANDNWYLQIETFDPHEPFRAPDDHIARIFDPDNVSALDWPAYCPVAPEDTEEVIQDIRKKYLALVSFCDESLGRVLDLFDKYDMWKDTMLIVNTDHGYLLGEHGWWSKLMMPDYQEIAHTPLFIWDPRSKIQGVRRKSLVQTIDLAPTILDFFGVDIPKDMEGKPLKNVIIEDASVREYGMFGSFGGVLSVTDGHYVYMIAPKKDFPIRNYTLVSTQMRLRMDSAVFADMESRPPFSFTKGARLMSLPAHVKPMSTNLPHGETALFDVVNDAKQTTLLNDPETAARLRNALVRLMRENDAPAELYECYGLKD